jgi:tRNA threonylcarbamoyladenosine biosynthesis protein TsaE
VERARLISRSPGQTEGAAGALAPALEAGDVVLVSGDVGTGKTTFVRGACRGLGVHDAVTSPSFTIGHLYEGRVPVAHVDLFRLESLEGEDPALLSDYLMPEAVAFVEWPQAAAPQLDPGRVVLLVGLAHAGADLRRIEVEGEARLVDCLRTALDSNENGGTVAGG